MRILPRLSKIKAPKFRMPQRRKKLAATTRRVVANPAVGEFDDEPQIRFRSALVVVIILHLVAVGGIYAFNQIKVRRTDTLAGGVAGSPSASTVPADEPPSVPRTVSQREPEPPSPTPAAADGIRTHQVKPGENLTRIAALYPGVTASDLEEFNSLKRDAVIQVGQVLNIPVPKQVATTASAAPVAKIARQDSATPKPKASSPTAARTHKVAKNETIISIAKKYGVSSKEIVSANKIKDPSKLQIGQVLKIPAK